MFLCLFQIEIVLRKLAPCLARIPSSSKLSHLLILDTVFRYRYSGSETLWETGQQLAKHVVGTTGEITDFSFIKYCR